MNYEFSLNKTALVSLIAGCVVISVLLFGAGLVVGSQWTASGPSSSEAVAENEQPDVPAEPVLNEKEPTAPKTNSPKKVNPDAASPPKQPAAPAPQETAAPAAQAQAVSAGIEIIREAAADPSAEAAESEPEYVTVQVGVFVNQDEANRLLKDIERKGYSPSFFSGRDAEARQWYAVRIGAYSDRQQAANAAVNFTRQEKIKAVVRPLGSL
jgi:cell division protein FtsN